MELIKIINARQVIDAHKQDKVKFGTAYKFIDFIKQTETQGTFYMEKIRDLLNKCAKKDEAGNLARTENGDIILLPETINEWQEGIKELETMQVDAPKIFFTPDELSNLELSAIDIVALGDFLKDE